MNNTKYLPIGFMIDEKYKIINILGEDDFEILYLVEDEKENFFILKELFLETFSSRSENFVSTIPEAQGVLEKRKKEIINEFDNPKIDSNSSKIKTYGYAEENHTIYTIMEFKEGSKVEEYLQFTPKESVVLPTLKKLLKNKNQSSPIFLKLLIFVTLILAALAYYAYNMVQVDKSKTTYIEETIMTPSLTLENNENKKVSIEKTPKENSITENNDTEKIDEILNDKDILATINNDFNRETVQDFLDLFISSTANSSIDDILFHYAKDVSKYFKLSNVDHSVIRADKERYNKKWIHREFTIKNFKILKTYLKNNNEYCEVQTITKWIVSTKNAKKISGESKGFMRLKKSDTGFKVTSIYTLK